MTTEINVQNFGKVTTQQLHQLIKQDKVSLDFDVIILMVGGLELLSSTGTQLIQGIEQLVLTLRNRSPKAWILVSTLLYRPRDETVLKEKIDVTNQLMDDVVKKLALVRCKVFIIRCHKVLVSTSDDKLLRPIHVYFQDGFFPSKLSGSLLAKFMVRCAKLVYKSRG